MTGEPEPRGRLTTRDDATPHACFYRDRHWPWLAAVAGDNDAVLVRENDGLHPVA